jgi:hypothetical protein
VGHLPRPASTQSRDRSQSPRSGRPADPRTGLIVSHQGWGMTQAVQLWWRQRTPRWTTLMWWKTISPGPHHVPDHRSWEDLFCTLNQLNKAWHVWPGSNDFMVHHPMPSSGAGGGTGGSVDSATGVVRVSAVSKAASRQRARMIWCYRAVLPFWLFSNTSSWVAGFRSESATQPRGRHCCVGDSR